jgi:hypothetical protein
MERLSVLLLSLLFISLTLATPSAYVGMENGQGSENKPHFCEATYSQTAIQLSTQNTLANSGSNQYFTTPSKKFTAQAKYTSQIKKDFFVSCLARNCGYIGRCYTPLFKMSITLTTENYLKGICPNSVGNCPCSTVLSNLSVGYPSFATELSKVLVKNCPAPGTSGSNSNLELSNEELLAIDETSLELDDLE